MSSFKSPELILEGKVLAVKDTLRDEVNPPPYSKPASMSRASFSMGKIGNSLPGRKSSKASRLSQSEISLQYNNLLP